MKRSKVYLALCVVAAISAILFYYRVPFGRWLWHLRHGNTVNVGSYLVPVPSEWAVESVAPGGELLARGDTNDQAHIRRLKASASILLLTRRPVRTEDFNRVLSREIASAKQKNNSVTEKQFDIGRERLTCFGGARLVSMGTFDLDPQSWICESPAGLTITVTAADADLADVWEIVSGIRRKQ